MLERLLSFFYPRDAVCIGCGALRVDDTDWSLCQKCLDGVSPLTPPFCPSCGNPGWAMTCPECAVAPPTALDGIASGYRYEGTAGKLVRTLKYQSVGHAVEMLADGMAQAMPEGAFDALIPVPLHRARERVRGFNQSLLLANALKARTGIPVACALLRTRPTRTQTRLSVRGRTQNVRGAFAVVSPVRGQMLLLVDDVLTTGATAMACAEALKEAGAARVHLLTAARAFPSRDDA